MSQKQQILRWLEYRGEHGLHSFELVEAHMPRGAAAICVLRKEGHVIESVAEPFKGESKGVRYFLRPERIVTAPTRTEHGPSRSNPYDAFSEWS